MAMQRFTARILRKGEKAPKGAEVFKARLINKKDNPARKEFLMQLMNRVKNSPPGRTFKLPRSLKFVRGKKKNNIA